MAKNQWVTVAANIALIMTVIGAAWLTVGELGVGETYDVVTGDTANISAETNVTYGGSVGFADQIVTFGGVVTLLVGLGAVSISSSNPKVFNDIIRYMPLLVAALALIEFSSIISDMFSGTYDFDLYNSGQNALHLFLTGSVIAGVSKLLGMRN
tara:strand:- start:5227 stop:5688 length:462 start_codon:yes stop_codon:yes gene_type:complete